MVNASFHRLKWITCNLPTNLRELGAGRERSYLSLNFIDATTSNASFHERLFLQSVHPFIIPLLIFLSVFCFFISCTCVLYVYILFSLIFYTQLVGGAPAKAHQGGFICIGVCASRSMWASPDRGNEAREARPVTGSVRTCHPIFLYQHQSGQGR